jgi:hypothetical protein
MKILAPLTILLIILLCTGCEKGKSDNVILKLYGDAYEDIAYSLIVTDGDIVLAGLRTVLTRRDGNYIESSDRNMGIYKTGPSGTQRWEATPGNGTTDQASRILELPGGEIVAAGYTTIGTGTSARTDIYVVKLSSEGSVIWESVIGGAGNQVATDIITTATGGFLVAGTTDAYRAESGGFGENIAGMKDFYLLEISSTGDSISSYAFGYEGNDFCSRIKNDITGGYILYGTTDNKSEPGLDKNSLLLIRLNEDASNRGAALIGDLDDQYAADIEVLSDGYLLTATVGDADENTRIEVLSLSGNIQSPVRFSRKFDINGLPAAANTMCKGDGFYYIGGRAGLKSSSDMLIVKIDSFGETVGEPFISGGIGSQEIFDIAHSDDGFVYAVGRTAYENNSMMCLLKLRY